MSVLLASASPRRQELLKFAVPDFEICPADIDETIPPEIAPEKASEYLAVQKARAVAKAHPEDVVIGCDTIVILDGEIMGKPKNEENAFEMLSRLSGHTHKVITGVCICSKDGEKGFSQCTEVDFYPLTDEEIRAYIATGDPMDKAGAYGIQSEGCTLVKGIIGDFSTLWVCLWQGSGVSLKVLYDLSNFNKICSVNQLLFDNYKFVIIQMLNSA